eukprot:scaffold13016_cov154-Amphora_coffeaeformis.AAC.12
MKMTTTTTLLSWIPPVVALIHVAASVMDLSFFLNENLPDDGGNVCYYGTGGFAFLLALLNQGVSYTGASYLSIVMHMVGAVKTYHRCHREYHHNDDFLFFLWDNEECTEHLVWIGLAVLVLLFGRHRRPHDDDGLPPGAILCFYFDEPTYGTKKKKSLSFLGEQLDKKYEEVESTTEKKHVWVRAGHHMESPERLIVRKEEEEEEEEIVADNEKQRSASPTINTPTSSPPTSPPKVMTTTTNVNGPILDDEHLSMTRLMNSVVKSTTPNVTNVPQRSTESTYGDQQQEQQKTKEVNGPSAQVAKVKDLRAAIVSKEGDDNTIANSSSLLPTIREARGLINEMLAKSSRGKEKIA